MTKNTEMLYEYSENDDSSDESEYLAKSKKRTTKKEKVMGGGSGHSTPSVASVDSFEGPPTSSSKPLSKMNVPIFISKLYEIVQNSKVQDTVGWSSEGQTFIVANSLAFSKDILPIYFKHNNFSSFVRQLNFYGFKSSSNLSLDGKNKRMWEFRHACFRQDTPQLLNKIKRKTCQQEVSSPENIKSEVDDLKADLETMRSQFYSMSKQLELVTNILRRAAMAKQKKRKISDDDFMLETFEGKAPKRQNVESDSPNSMEGVPIPNEMYLDEAEEFSLDDASK